MRKALVTILIVLGLLTLSSRAVEARVRVRGYVRRSTGSYVQPHYRTNPNRYRYDNWSSWENYNPYTGKRGSQWWWR